MKRSFRPKAETERSEVSFDEFAVHAHRLARWAGHVGRAMRTGPNPVRI